MEKLIKKIKKYPHEAILTVFFLAYSAYFTIASFLKYDHFYTGRFDLGNMTQTVWNTSQGRIFLLTDPNGTEEISRLAFHADFILMLFTPSYYIWSDPRVLLLFQSVILGIGGIFVFLIANHVLKNKNVGLALAFCYFINPAVNYTNLFDFHSVTLATTFFLGSFYFLFKKQYGGTVVFLVLAGITKEQTWAIIALIGLYIAVIHRKRSTGAFISITSIAIFVILFWYAIPQALGSQHFATKFFGDFGDSPTEIIKNIILNPIQTIQTFLLPDRIAYIKQLFLPLGYLSFIGFPMLIFAGPDLAINLLSDSSQMHQIYYQYSASVTPFIFISTVFGILWFKKLLPEIPYLTISTAVILFSILSAYSYGPLPLAKKPTDAMFKQPLANKEKVDRYLKSIPLEEKISASNNLGSHLSHRRFLFTVPVGMDEADKIVILVRESSNQKEKDALNMLLTDQNYILIYQDRDFYVFKNLRLSIK